MDKELQGLFDDTIFDDTLRVIDYLTRPIKELIKHPDFDIEAFKKAIALGRIPSNQLEDITIGIGGTNATN